MKEQIKRFRVLAAAALFLLFAMRLPVSADDPGNVDPLQGQMTGAETSYTDKSEEAVNQNWNHLLVIYDKNADDVTLYNTSVLLKMLTFMGYWTDCLDVKNCQDPDYEAYIGAILVTGTDHGFGDPIPDYTGRVLILGVIPDRILSRMGQESIFIDDDRKSETAGAASYPFDGIGNVIQAINLTGANQFSEPTYSEGEVNCRGQVWPLVTAVGDTRVITLQDYDSVFAESVLTQEIALWLWPYDDLPHAYGNYFVIDEIYPFSDPLKLLEVVEYLNEKKLNYCLSVMPLYAHGDYPAMQRLSEVLRYAQMHGSVMMHSPLTQNTITEEALEEQVTLGFEAYLGNEVYPLAMSIPSEWVIGQDLREMLGRFRTVFFEDAEAFHTKDPAALSAALNRFLALGVQAAYPALSVDGEGTPFLNTYAGVEYCSFADDIEVIKARIDLAASSPVSNESLFNAEQSIFLNHGNHIEWNKKSLVVNGETKSLDFEPAEIPEKFDYKRNVYYRTTADLAHENRVFITFTVVVLTLFAAFLARARRQMHRHFLFHREEPEPWETEGAGPPDGDGTADAADDVDPLLRNQTERR